MAEAVYAAIYEIVALIGEYATAIQIVATVASVAISAYNASEARKKAKAAYNSSLEDRAVVIRSSVADRPIIYGETVVGGPIVFIGTEGDKDQFLNVVVALAGHQITDVADVFFNDESIGLLDQDGAVVTGKYAATTSDFLTLQGVLDDTKTLPFTGNLAFQSVVWKGDGGSVANGQPDVYLQLNVDYTITNNVFTFGSVVPVGATVVATYVVSTPHPYVFCYKFLGGPGQQASAQMMSRFPGVWTAQHIGIGVAYVHLRLVYSADLFPDGVPAMKFLVRGKPVLDPRSGLTGYSRNPALHTRDYLVDPSGFNCDASEMDDACVIAAANICDEQVQTGLNSNGQPAYQARYVGAGVVSTGSDRKDNLEQIMSAMGPGEAGACYVQGQWKIYAGAYRTPVMSLSEKHLTAGGPITVLPRLSRSDLYNAVHGTFIDPAQKYAAIDFPPQFNLTYQSQDTEELVKDIELPFTDDVIRAQRIAKSIVERSRSSASFTASFKMIAYPLTPFDTVSLNIARYGFVSKPFTVLDRTFDTLGGVTLALREANPTMWNWSYTGAQLTTPPPPSQLPNPFTVADLVFGSVISDQSTLIVQDDGTIIPRILVTWSPSADSNVYYGGDIEIEYIRAGDSAWTAMPLVRGDSDRTYIVGPKAGGAYTVRARFVNGLGVSSPDWTYASVSVVGKTTPPSDVVNAYVSAEPYGLRVHWDSVPDRDLSTYVVRLGPSWDTGQLVTRDRVTSYLHRVQQAGDYKFWIKAVNTSNIESANAALAEFVVTIPAPSNLSGSINGSEMVLGWQMVAGTFAIDHFLLRQGATWESGVPLSGNDPTITNATTYRQQVRFGGARTFWVAAVDVAGNIGTPVSTTVTISNPRDVVASASVIDNFVYLRLADSMTTLPITSYVIRKGVSFAAGADVGDNGDGRFAVFFESSSGAYTYWFVATDSAGNTSTPTSVTAIVDQPPDYILQADVHSTFNGARANAVIEGGRMYTPLAAETWQSHFQSHGTGGPGPASGFAFDEAPLSGGFRLVIPAPAAGSTTGWNSPQDQVDAGYPVYFEPSVENGTYEEILDYGAVLQASTISATLSAFSLVGSVSAVCTISYKQNPGDAWTVGPTGQTQVVATNFRFARVHYDFEETGSAGHNLLGITDLEIKLSVKLRNDAGMGAALASDVAGTFVPFSYDFIDVSSITVTPADTAPCFITYSFVDVPNPAGFYVYAWDKNGNRITKNFSWSAKGY